MYISIFIAAMYNFRIQIKFTHSTMNITQHGTLIRQIDRSVLLCVSSDLILFGRYAAFWMGRTSEMRKIYIKIYGLLSGHALHSHTVFRSTQKPLFHIHIRVILGLNDRVKQVKRNENMGNVNSMLLMVVHTTYLYLQKASNSKILGFIAMSTLLRYIAR